MRVAANPAPSLPVELPPTPADADAARRAGSQPAAPGRTSRSAGLGAAEASPPSDPSRLAGLAACVAEARAAATGKAKAPPDPSTFASLRARLEAALPAMEPAYREAVGEPLLRALARLGPGGYARLLAEDPDRVGGAALLLDLAQAVLQQAEGFAPRATAAFQEVVSDIYAGFVLEGRRRGVKPPDAGTLPPLVRWGPSAGGPYTWPATATARLGAGAGVVSLPATNAKGGLLAWPTLAHEAGGHDILEADQGLTEELSRAVASGLAADGIAPAVASYWVERVEEAAADVLGVLNMGPASAAGLIGYVRAVNGAWRGTAALRNVGREEDVHPADIVRGYLVAETVRLLSFPGAARWADRLVTEVDRDLGRIWLGRTQVTAGVAKESAAAVARALVRSRLGALEGKALGEIQDWTAADEAVVARLRRGIAEAVGGDRRNGRETAARLAEGDYAAHAVAAGIYEALSGGAPPDRIATEMIGILAEMRARREGDDTARSVA